MVLGLSVLLLVKVVMMMMLLLLIVVVMLCFLSSRVARLESQRLTLSVLVRNVIDLAVRESVAVGRVHVERRL